MPPKTKRSSNKGAKTSKTPPKSSGGSRKRSGATHSGAKSKKSSSSAGSNASSSHNGTSAVLPPSSGYLVTCDIPTKQFIKHLNGRRTVDKQFILEDLDATHLLITGKAKDEIFEKVEAWMDKVSFISLNFVFCP